MQMGSGTWDITAGLSYVQEREQFHWGVDAHLLVRTADNSRDYLLGDRGAFNIWAYSVIWDVIQPGIQLSAQNSGKIHGSDPSLPGPDSLGRYPTAVLNPNNYGGDQVDATAFVRFHPPSANWYVDARYTHPIYQHLNGPQVGLRNSLGVSIGFGF